MNLISLDLLLSFSIKLLYLFLWASTRGIEIQLYKFPTGESVVRSGVFYKEKIFFQGFCKKRKDLRIPPIFLIYLLIHINKFVFSWSQSYTFRIFSNRSTLVEYLTFTLISLTFHTFFFMFIVNECIMC